MEENGQNEEKIFQRQKNSDYDSGLLQDAFNPIIGTSEKKYDDRCDRLARIAARLERLKYKNKIENDKQLDQILNDIYRFLDEKLPSIIPTVSDYKQKEGRIITIGREDSSAKPTCVIETLDNTTKLVREEQYFEKNNQIRKLESRAMAFLDDNVFPWHRNDWIEEIDPSEKLGEVMKNGEADE